MSIQLSAVLALAAVLAGQGHHEGKWWDSVAVKARLQLTDGQVQRLDRIYEGMLPERIRYAERAEQLARQLDGLMVSAGATEQEVATLADEVGVAQALRNRARTLMLYRMHQVLTPDQRSQLKQLLEERREASRPRG